MPNLELRIDEWRARMTQALPHREEAVAELEEHLREHVEVLQRQGKSNSEAFALAQAMLGEPQAVAREFDQMPVGLRPGSIVLPALALLLAFSVGVSVWSWSRRLPITPLQVAFLGTYVTALFCVLGSGLIATSAFVTTLLRPLHERERCGMRRVLRKLARCAVVFLPIGITLRAVWRAQLVPNEWTLWSYNLQYVGAIVSVALLFFVQSRPSASDRVRWLTAIYACPVLFFSGFGPRMRVADIPVAWLCAVFLLGQVFLVLPRFRIVRVC